MQTVKSEILDEAIRVVSNVTGVSIEEIKGSNRKTHIVSARQMFCGAMTALQKLHFTLDEIGLFINISHCSVLHNKKRVVDYSFSDPAFKKMYASIIYELQKNERIENVIASERELQNNYTLEELKPACELLENKIKMLEEWLVVNPLNNYRMEVLRDVRDYKRCLISKQNQITEITQDQMRQSA